MNTKKNRKKILDMLDTKPAIKDLLSFFKKQNISPAIVDGDLKFHAPSGLIDTNLKTELLKREVEIIEEISKANKFYTKKPGFTSPNYVSKEKLLEVIKKNPKTYFKNFLTKDDLEIYEDWEDEDEPFCLHEGNLDVEGRFISYGAVFIIVGDLRITGNLCPYSGTFENNYLFVTGNVYCKNLTTIRNSVMAIGGSLVVDEILLVFDMDTHIEVYENVTAKYIISGYTSCLYANGEVNVETLFGSLIQKNKNGGKRVITQSGIKEMDKSPKASPKMKKSDELKEIERKDIHVMSIFIDAVFEDDEYNNQLVLSEDEVFAYLVSDNEVLK